LAVRTIRPAELAADAPFGEWGCRGSDIWDAFCAAEAGDADALREVLARDPNLYRAEYWYTPPIHFAVRAGRIGTTRVLVEAGADPAWRSMAGDDLATLARERGEEELARLLEAESRGRRGRPKPPHPADDPVVAAAGSGDVERVRARLAEAGREPALDARIRLGTALHAAARGGHRALVELLLAHGADPNFTIDSSGSATWAAATPELRQLLVARGGRLDCFDLVFLNEDDEAVRRVEADPREADAGCGGVLAAACTLGKRELLVRLLAAGARVPRVLTACRGYLMSAPDTLRLLLERADMDPNLPNWQRATPLHDLCGRDYRGRANPQRAECARLLLDAGAGLSTRDADYRSTPLAFAARSGLIDMVELLLSRGAPAQEADAEPWATPLAWAERRGHVAIAGRLRAAGASAQAIIRPT
jgi:ankyrin repeat protein